MLGQASETTILISTHELGEIEGVATHVGFLEEGRLLFDEPMDELRNRFRAVRIVFDGPARLPNKLSPDWLQLSIEGNVLAFIDSRFSEPDSRERLQAQLQDVRSIDAEPVPLRTIFTTLARAVRDAAERGE